MFRHPDIHPVGDRLNARNCKDGSQPPASTEIREHLRQRATASKDLPVWGDQVHGAVERFVREWGKVRNGAAFVRREALNPLVDIPALEPAYPRPAEPTVTIVEQDWPGQHAGWETASHAPGAARTTASERAERMARNSEIDRRTLGLKLRLVRNTRKSFRAGSIHIVVPVQPV